MSASSVVVADSRMIERRPALGSWGAAVLVLRRILPRATTCARLPVWATTILFATALSPLRPTSQSESAAPCTVGGTAAVASAATIHLGPTSASPEGELWPGHKSYRAVRMRVQ